MERIEPLLSTSTTTRLASCPPSGQPLRVQRLFRLAGSALVVSLAHVAAACGSEGATTSNSRVGQLTSIPSTTVGNETTSADSSPLTTDLSSDEGITILSLHEGDIALAPGRVVFDLAGFDPYRVAMSPTGLIVVASAVSDELSVYALADDSTPVDTGIRLTADFSSFAFGPYGDLFTIERALVGPSTVSQFHPELDGSWTMVTEVSEPITGECGTSITATRAGCPLGTGPSITFDPPVHFDDVVGDPLLAGTDGTGTVRRIGGDVEREWIARLDVPLAIDCTDDACAYLLVPGPDSSAVYVPFLGNAGNRRAVFILDDRQDAGAAFVDGEVPIVLGIRGSELLCVKTYADRASIIAIDLTPIMGNS